MDCFGGRRKKRNNNGNGNQSRNQKPDSNENFFESQAAEFVPNMGVELDKEIVEKKRDNVNEPKTPDSNEGFFESQAAKFVSKMGMELDKEIVEVTLNMEEFPGGEQIMQDANKNRVVTKEGIRVNRVDFGTYFHGFGLRKNDVIFLLNGQPIISEASVNMNLLRIINSSFNSKLYMELYRKDTMPSVVNAEPSVVRAEPSVVRAEPSVVRAESLVLNAPPSVVNRNYSVVTLNNQGINLCSIPNAGHIFVLIDTLQCRIQSEHHGGKYLIIENGSIVLRNSSAVDATFTVRIYTEPCTPSGTNSLIVTLQHNASGEYILKSSPNTLRTSSTDPHNLPLSSYPGVTTINRTSSYLFNVAIDQCTSCNTPSNTVYQFQPLFQPLNSTTAIGFVGTGSTASLMSPTACETHFWL